MTYQRFSYLPRRPGNNPADLLPLLPLKLQRNAIEIDSVALVDSGADMNILPNRIGAQFGVDWNSLQVPLSIGGGGGAQRGKALAVDALIPGFPSAPLLFCWLATDAYPPILGQVDFFFKFDVCFFRSQAYFELALHP